MNQYQLNALKQQIDIANILNNTVKKAKTNNVKVRFPEQVTYKTLYESYMRIAGGMITWLEILIFHEEYEYCEKIQQLLLDNKLFIIEFANKAGITQVEFDNGEIMSLMEMLEMCDATLKKEFNI